MVSRLFARRSLSHIGHWLNCSGDVLIYVNHLNLLHPPIALTLDRVKSEFTALRKQNQLIQIGICRCSDRALLNNTTMKHLGALTFEQFENLSRENRKSPSSSSIVLTESKKLLHLFSNKKKSVSSSKGSSARDSGFVENDRKWFDCERWCRYIVGWIF